MASLAFVNGLSQKLSLLRGDQRGTAAIEFAAVGMTMVILWVGCAEVVAGVAQQRRVTLAARTVADLTTRFENLNNADKDAVLDATHVILQTTLEGPYKVTLSVVNIDADGVAKVGWREVRGNGKGAEGPDSGSPVTLPSDVLKVPNSQLIWCQVSYDYKPLGAGVVLENKIYPLSDQIFMTPRRSQAVTRNNS